MSERATQAPVTAKWPGSEGQALAQTTHKSVGVSEGTHLLARLSLRRRVQIPGSPALWLFCCVPPGRPHLSKLLSPQPLGTQGSQEALKGP